MKIEALSFVGKVSQWILVGFYLIKVFPQINEKFNRFIGGITGGLVFFLGMVLVYLTDPTFYPRSWQGRLIFSLIVTFIFVLAITIYDIIRSRV